MKKVKQCIILGKIKKKAIMAITCLLAFCYVGGCASSQQDRINSLAEKSNAEDESIDSVMNQVLESLNAKDEELLISLFSDGVKEDVPSIHENINQAMEFYQGTGEITKSTHLSYTHNERGDKSVYLTANYTVITDNQTYMIRIVLQDRNDFDESMEGLYLLQITTEEAHDDEFKWENKDSDPGIYLQNDKADEYIATYDLIEKETK